MTKSKIAYKRLFIGLELDKDTLKILNKYRDKMGREPPFFRWTAISNLHITVLFLGDVGENKIPDILTRLQNITTITKPFVMTFDKPIYAPPNRATSMIWVKMKESDQFKILADSIVKKIYTVDTTRICELCQQLNAENRKNTHEDIYKEVLPHITLARLKGDVVVSDLPKLGRSSLENCEIIIYGMTLFESKLTPAGPEYGVVQRFKFG